MNRTIALLISSVAFASAAIAQESPRPQPPREARPRTSPPAVPVNPTQRPARRGGLGLKLPKRRRGALLDPRSPDPVTPTWKVGQWWEVAADFAVERGAEGLSLERPLPELAGLGRRGPRPGYHEVARWRFRVSKRQRFPVPGAGDGSWHLGWFVEVRRIDREAPRRRSSLTLVFVGPSKALSDVGVLHPGQKIRWRSFDADAILEPPLQAALQLLPLAWPDLRGAERLEGKGHRAEPVVQRRSTDRSGVYFELRAGGAEASSPPVRVRWRAGEPWPVRIRGRGFELRLLRTSPKPEAR